MIKLRQIKVSILNDTKEELIRKICKKINIKETDIISLKISKKSVDARDKENINFVYEVILDVKDLSNIKFNNDVLNYDEEEYSYNVTGNKIMKERPIIVGSGPAGLFLGYMLSKEGYSDSLKLRGESDKYEFVEGLGILPIVFSPHHSKDKIDELMGEIGDREVFSLENNTALKIENNTYEVIKSDKNAKAYRISKIEKMEIIKGNIK